MVDSCQPFQWQKRASKIPIPLGYGTGDESRGDKEPLSERNFLGVALESYIPHLFLVHAFLIFTQAPKGLLRAAACHIFIWSIHFLPNTTEGEANRIQQGIEKKYAEIVWQITGKAEILRKSCDYFEWQKNLTVNE